MNDHGKPPVGIDAVYTIGYGGASPSSLVQVLAQAGISVVIDVRLRPDRACMNFFTKNKDPKKGIEGLLATAAIRYCSMLELGNIFLDSPDWKTQYQRFLHSAGELVTERLTGIQGAFCLLCCEKSPEDCHRKLIAEYLQRTRGWEVVHLTVPPIPKVKGKRKSQGKPRSRGHPQSQDRLVAQLLMMLPLRLQKF